MDSDFLHTDDLDENITLPGAIKLDSENVLAVGKKKFPLFYRDGLTIAEKDGLAVGMAVAAAIRTRFAAQFEQIVGVLVIDGNNLIEDTHEILKEHGFIMIDGDTHRRVWDIDKCLTLADTGPIDDFLDLVGDIHELDLRLAFQVDFLLINFHTR